MGLRVGYRWIFGVLLQILLVVRPFSDKYIVAVLLLLTHTSKVFCDFIKVIFSFRRVYLFALAWLFIETVSLGILDRGCHSLRLFAVSPDF